jgi:hypothetical protein
MSNIINKIKSRIEKAMKETAGNIYQDLENNSTISVQDINDILKTDNIQIPQQYKEIEFFTSNDNKQHTIYSLLSNNLSITAKYELKKLLSNYITNINELNNRQKFITTIKNNEQILKHTITTAKNEKAIYWFIKPHNPELSELLNSVYFTKVAKFIDLKKLNDTKDFMNYYYTFLMIISPLWGLLSPIIFFIMPYFFTKYFLKIPIAFSSYLATLKATLFGDNIFNTIKGILSMFLIKQVGGSSNDKPSSFFKKFQILLIMLIYRLISSPYIKYAYLAFVIIGYLWSLFNSYTISRNYYKFIKFLHNRLQHIHTLILTTNSLHLMINENINILPEEILYSYNRVSNILKKPIIQEIISEENKTHFNKSYNLLCNKGIILSLYHKISNYISDKDILTLIKFNSILETYISLANNPIFKHFNKAIYISNIDKPQLTVLSIYNPICGGYEKCVPNSINLFDDEEHLRDDEEHLSDDEEHLSDDEEHLSDDEEHLSEEEEHLSEEEEHLSDDEEHLSDDEEHLNEEEEHLNGEEEITKEKHPSEGFKNMVLTGPNGSGKSTFLKTLMTSVILAQTIGFVPAKTMQLTPFTYISTYLNIPDCTGKESLFQAEMSRCHNHLTKLKELDEQESAFSFNIMDEIFVSTNYYEGISGAWAVMKNVSKYNNAINIITTHFDKCVESVIPGYIYKHFTLNDNLTNDYKLLDGINKKHCALKLLEKYGFDTDLVDEANSMYNKII